MAGEERDLMLPGNQEFDPDGDSSQDYAKEYYEQCRSLAH